MLQGNIAASFVQLLIDWLRAQGVDPQEWTGFDEAPARELSRIDVKHWQAMLERVASAFDEPALGLHIGRRMGPREAGLLGYMASCCTTMGEACLRLSQFEHLVYNVNPLKIVTDMGHVTLIWGVEKGRPGPLVDECAIAGLVAFCRSLGGPTVMPDHVAFVNAPPADPVPYCEFFGIEPEFDAAQTVVRYPLAAMGAAIAGANPALKSVLDNKARSLLVRLPSDGEPLPGLFRALQDAIAAGTPTLRGVTERL